MAKAWDASDLGVRIATAFVNGSELSVEVSASAFGVQFSACSLYLAQRRNVQILACGLHVTHFTNTRFILSTLIFFILYYNI